MQATQECLACLHKQARRTILHHIKTQAHITLPIPQAPPSCPPPKLAIDVYRAIGDFVAKMDLYHDQKIASIQKAKIALEQIKAHTDKPHTLESAIKLAALGNIIDYGSADEFDIESCLFDMDSMEFAIYDISILKQRLASARELVYIGDNAGEDVFDSECIKLVMQLYPQLKVYYFTRGAPIINDITLQDLRDNHSPILEICEVVDSGVRSPGFLYDDASAYAKGLYDRADVVLAKGMGNFECLEDKADPRVFLLFKIKCAVVANFLQHTQGKFVLKNLAPESI